MILFFGGLIGITVTEPVYAGATVELDQKVYTWTDRVYITVVSPASNLNPNVIDIIPVSVSTREHTIPYTLFETGPNTGIFTGYVTLTGDPNLKGTTGVDGKGTNPTGTLSTCSPTCGPTNGFLPAENADGVSVSFEFASGQSVTGSALVRWNIGEVSWLQPSYSSNDQGVCQIVDPDLNLNPNIISTLDTTIFSDTDPNGIKLTMTETGQGTGIFQGIVYFTTNSQSSGNMLHVTKGDKITCEYIDRTLPPPYTPSDQLALTSTASILTNVPPAPTPSQSNCPSTGCVQGGDILNVNVTPTIGTAPLTVSYKASFTGGSAMKSVVWSFGDGNSVSGVMNGVYTYRSTGSYTGTVDVDATDGTSYTQQFIVSVTGSIGANMSTNSTISNPNAGTMNAYQYLQQEHSKSGLPNPNVQLNATISNPNTNQINSTVPIPTTENSKIPTWVKNIFIWYGNGKISDDQLLTAIRYLIQIGIIKV